MNVEVNQKGKKGLRARVVLVVALAFLACMLNASFVFGQTGSTVNDSSTNSNEGTIYGATLDDGGKMGKALSLDGVDDYFNLGSPANLDLGTGDFSISAWIKTTGSSQRDIVTDYNTAGGNKGYFFIVTTASALQGNIYDPSAAQVISTSGIIKDNTWHHAVFTQTRSSTTGLKLYLDGAETAYSLQNNPTAIGSITNTNANTLIGAETDGAGTVNYFNGLIDDVRIYNKVLSLLEISFLAGTKLLATLQVASAASCPSGYIPTSLGADGDDGDATKWRYLSCYVDNDVDGVGAGAQTQSVLAGLNCPSGYGGGNTDVDDNNIAVWQKLPCYTDADGDGFGADGSNPGTANLAGHWKLDEGSGTTASDSSANSNNGVISESDIWTAGKTGKSLSFSCTPIHGGLSDWSAWSTPCGSATRTKTCTNPAPNACGNACSGATSETQEQGSNTCGWSSFGDWGACSAGCGSGTQTKTRTCSTGSAGSAHCSGSAIESQACGTGSSTCGWSGFGGWGACSASCGGGTQTKTRSCSTGSAGSANCAGSASQSQSCNTQSCCKSNGGSCSSNGQCCSGNCWDVDADGDGWAPNTGSRTCQSGGKSSGDCDDNCNTCYPGSNEITSRPDGRDQDCDGTVDENTGTGQPFQNVDFYATSADKSCNYGQTHPWKTQVDTACNNWCKGGSVSCPTISCTGQWSTGSFSFDTCTGGSQYIYTGSSRTCCRVGTQTCNCPGLYH